MPRQFVSDKGKAWVLHVGKCLQPFLCIVVGQAAQTDLLQNLEASQKNTEKACSFLDLSK